MAARLSDGRWYEEKVMDVDATRGRAIVIGASLAGLFAATLLRKAGWHAEVFERSRDRLVTISCERGPLRGWGRRLIAAQLRPLGYELAGPRLVSPRGSQTPRSRPIARPSHHAMFYTIWAVAPCLVHKFVHNPRSAGGVPPTFTGQASLHCHGR